MMTDWQPDRDTGIGENLPLEETENLVIHIMAALLHANEREWVAGYDLLLAGLRAAEDHPREGAPWGQEAVYRYRRRWRSRPRGSSCPPLSLMLRCLVRPYGPGEGIRLEEWPA